MKGPASRLEMPSGVGPGLSDVLEAQQHRQNKLVLFCMGRPSGRDDRRRAVSSRAMQNSVRALGVHHATARLLEAGETSTVTGEIDAGDEIGLGR